MEMKKNCFTVVLSARADGTKLKPSVVFKGKGIRLNSIITTTAKSSCGLMDSIPRYSYSPITGVHTVF